MRNEALERSRRHGATKPSPLCHSRNSSATQIRDLRKSTSQYLQLRTCGTSGRPNRKRKKPRALPRDAQVPHEVRRRQRLVRQQRALDAMRRGGGSVAPHIATPPETLFRAMCLCPPPSPSTHGDAHRSKGAKRPAVVGHVVDLTYTKSTWRGGDEHGACAATRT